MYIQYNVGSMCRDNGSMPPNHPDTEISGMAPTKSSIERRFWQSTQLMSNGCIEWRGTVRRDRYGSFAGVLAHRAAYEFEHGAIGEYRADQATCVLHECHNTLCVNPKHLKLGTHKENSDMKWAAGRGRGTHKPLVFNGVEYASLMHASRATGLSRMTLRTAVRRGEATSPRGHK